MLLDMGVDLGMWQKEPAEGSKDKHTPIAPHAASSATHGESAQVPPPLQIPTGTTGLDAGHGSTPDG